ncbi:hypothetical protein [Haliangium sp.]|uniref:hypothetical protein n=1 Tax=Haliangium sp. TaxID=2663208 RepID=UPI003D0BA1ED
MALPLDSVATIFIFLIGLPAILLQTLPAEVRHTVLQERRQVAVFTVGPIVVATLAVIAGAYLTSPAAGLSMTEDEAEMVWLVIETFLIGICGSAALVLTERWRRKSVVRRLRRAAARGIESRGRPVEEELMALVELGVQSRPGEDKTLVIDALDALVGETQARPGYDGAQLEELVKGLEDVLVGGAHTGSPGNFKAGADLLERLVWEASGRSDSDDLKMSVQLAGILGRAALRYEQPHDQIKFLEILAFAGEGEDTGYSTWASQALFEIGSEAIESGRILVAMTALSKLESLVFTYSPVSGELANDYIGLVAHFHARGPTGRDYSREFVDPELFAAPLPELIRTARAACIQGARFQTGDHLARLLSEIESAPAQPN